MELIWQLFESSECKRRAGVCGTYSSYKEAGVKLLNTDNCQVDGHKAMTRCSSVQYKT